jgi:hypothetical protein
MPSDQIEKFTDNMVKEKKLINRNAKKIAWYMRGGVDYVDIMNMSQEEVDDLNSIIEENLETTKKTKMPFF